MPKKPLKEGFEKRGGVNPSPLVPRPNLPPPAQKPAASYYCFVQDQSSHWYKIPVSMREQFYELEEGGHDDELDDLFNGYRCMHPVNYMFPIVEVLKEA